jgi:UDP-N-acetylmuramyl pentapeptide synthase
MYLRSTPRRNKDGSEVRYLQLAHNVWDPQKRRSSVQVIYNFGREDAANREALQRLAASVTRFLDPGAAMAASADAALSTLRDLLRPGDVMLAEASHAMHLEVSSGHAISLMIQ